MHRRRSVRRRADIRSATRLVVAAVLLPGLLAVTAPGLAATPIPQRSGSLRSVVANTRLMGRASRSYTPPTEAELELARRAFAQLLAGRLKLARPALHLLGFDLFVLHDDRRGRSYRVVREIASRRVTGWGLFVVDPKASRELVFEAPHARHDRGTGLQAAELMARLGGRALLLSTAYRCATPLASRCSGRTVACSRDKRRLGRYRLSDVAHTRRSVFQVAHESLFAASPATTFVQLHGFARRPGRRLHVIISDGTHGLRGGSWPSNRLATELRDELARRHRPGVVSCNERRGVPLCGTDNVQGRHANGSIDPCLRDGRRASGRFLHLEQSPRARRRRSRYFEALVRALATRTRGPSGARTNTQMPPARVSPQRPSPLP